MPIKTRLQKKTLCKFADEIDIGQVRSMMTGIVRYKKESKGIGLRDEDVVLTTRQVSIHRRGNTCKALPKSPGCAWNL